MGRFCVRNYEIKVASGGIFDIGVDERRLCYGRPDEFLLID
jgi:hypothetical protein